MFAHFKKVAANGQTFVDATRRANVLRCQQADKHLNMPESGQTFAFDLNMPENGQALVPKYTATATTSDIQKIRCNIIYEQH